MKNNKLLGKITILAVIVALLAASITAVVPAGAKLDISLISQESDPANPGEIVDLRFKVENTGGSSTDNLYFEFIEEYPFEVYTGDAQQSIGSLQGWQKDEEGVIVLYKIKVDESAVEKTYYVDIRYKEGVNGDWTTVKDFPLRVRTRDLVLSVDSIKTDPALIAPGDKFELSLTLNNNADSIMRDIRIKLDLADSETPFAPEGSTSEKQIYQITPDTGKIMRFDLIALPDAEGDIYKVPVNISYTDETGTTYSKTDMISLKVTANPDLLVTVDSSEIQGKQRSGNVVIKIVNRGLTDIKLATAKLVGDKKIEVLSEPEIYVGNIDSDDYETVEYKINVKSYDKFVTLPLELRYRDATNEVHNDKIDVQLRTNITGLLASSIASIINGIIIIVVIVGIGLALRWMYLRRKKRK